MKIVAPSLLVLSSSPPSCSSPFVQILSLTHLLTAVHAAALATAQGQLKAQTCVRSPQLPPFLFLYFFFSNSKNALLQHSEILYQLTPSSNIADGIKQFGLSASTKNLLVVRLTSPAVDTEDLSRHLKGLVQGQLASLQEVGNPDTVAYTSLNKVCLVIGLLLFLNAHTHVVAPDLQTSSRGSRKPKSWSSPRRSASKAGTLHCSRGPVFIASHVYVLYVLYDY